MNRQPEFGGWAFNLPRGTPCLEKWNNIPDDTDILITHGPALGRFDGGLCTVLCSGDSHRGKKSGSLNEKYLMNAGRKADD